MSQILFLLIAFGFGAALGIGYFAWLWHTVKHLPEARHPSLALVGGFGARISVLLAGFALLLNGRWEPISAALLGFIAAREVLIRRLGRKG